MSVDAEYSFPVIVEPSPTSPTAGSRALAPVADRAFLGFGLLRPFRRDKTDFLAGGGAALVRSAVEQVLGTRADSGNMTGELPWRPEFGSWLHLLRFANQDAIFEDVAQVYVADAVRRWEPRARVGSVRVLRPSDRLALTTAVVRVTFDVVQENAPGNNVLVRNQTIDVPLAA